MALRTFQLREAHGLIWLWRGETRDVYPEAPYFQQLELVGATLPSKSSIRSTTHAPSRTSWTFAHLAFVHRTTIGAGDPEFRRGSLRGRRPTGIKVWVTNARDEGQTPRSIAELKAAAVGAEPTLDFLFPGIWLLNIGPRLRTSSHSCRLTSNERRYYLRVYHRIRNPLIAKAFEALMGLSNRFILDQDRRVVVTQTPNNSSDALEDRLIGADRAISQFRSLHARPVRARVKAQDDLAPLWRSLSIETTTITTDDLDMWMLTQAVATTTDPQPLDAARRR